MKKNAANLGSVTKPVALLQIDLDNSKERKRIHQKSLKVQAALQKKCHTKESDSGEAQVSGNHMYTNIAAANALATRGAHLQRRLGREFSQQTLMASQNNLAASIKLRSFEKHSPLKNRKKVPTGKAIQSSSVSMHTNMQKPPSVQFNASAEDPLSNIVKQVTREQFINKRASHDQMLLLD